MRLVRMVPGSAQNWIAVNASSTSNLNKRNENKNNNNSTLKKINWPVALPGRFPSHPAGDRHLWFNAHFQPSGCSCRAIRLQSGTSFRSYRSLPTGRVGESYRFSKGGDSRCGHPGVESPRPAAQYELCGLPDRNAGAPLRRGSIYRGLHHECARHRACPRGCHHR